MAQVRTRKRGKTYSYIFEAGQVNGKRKVVEKGGFATKDAAYEAGVAAYTDWKHGDIGITSERITLAEFTSLWLKAKPKDIRITTLESYTTIIDARITPYLGQYITQDLTPANIESWIVNLYKSGYSKGYIRQCRMILKSILDYAVHPSGLILSNPCSYVKVPKNAPVDVIKRTVIRKDRYHDLLAKFPIGTPMYIPFILFFHTGMRLGEMLGLAWEDIDFEEKSITISKQRVYRSKGATHECITETKTEKSERKIFMSAALTQELQAEKERQFNLPLINMIDKDGFCYTYSKELLVQKGLIPIHLVCVNKKGRPVSRALVSKNLRDNGLNSHSFRHTQATRLAEAKVSPVTVARRLGHANIDTTLNIYTHDTEIMQKEAVLALEKNADRTIVADNLQT